ncbi:MAG: hypothetical protein ACLRK4_19865 [Ruthenibacterium lactatiformans]
MMQRLQDNSNEKTFQFSLRCEECGLVWNSSPVPFSKAEDERPEQKKVVYEIMYQREKEIAFCRAYQDALECFNLCPVCARLVCNCCFRICSDVDMCSTCAEHLGEGGEAVASAECTVPQSQAVSNKSG